MPYGDAETSLFEEEWSECSGGSLFDELEHQIGEFNASQEYMTDDHMDSQSLDARSTQAVVISESGFGDGMEVQNTSGPDLMSLFGGNDGYVANPAFERHGGSDRVVTDLEWNPDAPFSSSFANSMSYQQTPEFHEQATIPYLYRSIEEPNLGVSQYQHRQHINPLPPCPTYVHRRSVSEPPASAGPDNFHSHHITGPPIPQGQVILSRPGHIIGTPESMLDDTPRGKRAPLGRPPKRFHPYSDTKQGGKEASRSKQVHKRSKTQPIRGPTSVPLLAPATSQAVMMMSESPVMLPQQISSFGLSPLQLVSSRICTPTPSPERVPSPSPGLSSARKLPRTENGASDEAVEMQRPSSIPVTVQQLQDMITEAVQKALKFSEESIGGQNSEPGEDAKGESVC